jgi:hypothetical protein
MLYKLIFNFKENENELENQKKINNQLRDEIEMLKCNYFRIIIAYLIKY